jgi:hypothetical protein
MFIANEKQQQNIAEYILYIFQIEDVLRACHFDRDTIRQNIVLPQAKSEALVEEAMLWYDDIIKEMKSRGLEKKGHLYRVSEVMMELVYLHSTLLDVLKDQKYIDLHERAKPHIEDFRKKSNIGNLQDVDVCFHALYMKLLMRLKKQEISVETEEAFDHMRILLAYLSRAYHRMKNGEEIVG